MNEELILRLLQLFNVIVCMSIIFVMLWAFFGQKKVKITTIFLLVTLIALLLLKVLGFMPYDEVIILCCLLLIFYHHLKGLTAPMHTNSVNQNMQADALQLLQLRAQEQERSRIYANLHDDVGAQLLQLIYSAKDEESRNIAKSILNEMRKAVASTQNIQLDAEQLTEDIINETQYRLQAAKIEVILESNIHDKRQKLTLIAPNVICRIIREVISNVIKHAKTTQVNLSIKSTETHFNVVVQDNGQGFQDITCEGKGLKTIKKRAESIAAQVQWHTEQGKGSIFQLSYPL